MMSRASAVCRSGPVLLLCFGGAAAAQDPAGVPLGVVQTVQIGDAGQTFTLDVPPGTGVFVDLTPLAPGSAGQQESPSAEDAVTASAEIASEAYSVGQPTLQLRDTTGKCLRAVPQVEGCGTPRAELAALEGPLPDGGLRLAFRAADGAAQERYVLQAGNGGSPFPQTFELLVRQRDLPAPPPPVVLTPVSLCAPEPARCSPLEARLEPEVSGYFSFTAAEPGQRVQIDMESVEVDSYLELRGPIPEGTGAEESELLATDDDGGNLLQEDSRDDLNARLRHTLPRAGTYAIVARTSGFGATQGKYRLAARLLPPPPPAPPPIALQPGQPVTGRFSEDDPTIGLSGPPYHLYSVTGRPGETLVIDMVSNEVDSILEAGEQIPVVNVADPLSSEFASLARDDDSGGERNAQLKLRFGGTGPTTITLRASTFAAGTTGDYVITAAPAP